MRIYYDTEFIEDGRTIDLISIGMVAEDGREYYGVVSETQTDQGLHDRITRHEWLMSNVVPSLPHSPRRDGLAPYEVPRRGEQGRFSLDMTNPDVLPRWVIAKQVAAFIGATPSAELWAWYGAYDHVALCQLWGPMVALPPGVPMFTRDLKQEAARLGNPTMPEQADGHHNALADARHNRTMGEFLLTLPKE